MRKPKVVLIGAASKFFGRQTIPIIIVCVRP